MGGSGIGGNRHILRGAELLRKPGSFLYVFGGQVDRFQSFYMDEPL